jgi:hypothetical protein
MSPGRTKNTVKSKPLRITSNQTEREYLEAIVNAGTSGSNNWTEVAHKFIGEGIERAIRRGTIPRKKMKVPYETEES